MEELAVIETRLKERWIGEKSGNSIITLQKDELVKDYLKEIATYQSETNFLNHPKTLTNSAFLCQQIRVLHALTLAFFNPQSVYYQQEELFTIIEKNYEIFLQQYNGITHYGNWWDWQIGIPNYLLPMLFLLKEKWSQEKILKACEIIQKYVPDPYYQFYTVSQDKPVVLTFKEKSKSTGANRTDLAYLHLMNGVLQQNKEMIQDAIKSTFEVFDNVTKGDGFYQDGSMIQHSSIPYNGSYGAVLVEGIARIYPLLEGTELAISTDLKKRLAEIVEKSYLPFLHEGEILIGVKGRSIAREDVYHNEFGSTMMFDLYALSDLFSANFKEELQRKIGYEIKKHQKYYQHHLRDLKDEGILKQILSKDFKKEVKKPQAHFYPSMDRGLYQKEGTTIGIHLYSNRISAFEAGNGENLLAQYTGDGMVTSYQQDDNFLNRYFGTLDFRYLPGVTMVDTPLMPSEHNFSDLRGDTDHTGGIALDENLVCGMILKKEPEKDYPHTLLAKKSYFILNDILLCLGSGLTASGTGQWQTVVENRLLPEKVETVADKLLEKNQKVYDLVTAGIQMAYYGEENTILVPQLVTEKRTFATIDATNNGKNTYVGHYYRLTIPHGTTPQKASYSYGVLLGDTTEKRQEQYEKRPVIVENSESCQIIKNQEGTIYLGNIYEKGKEILGVTFLIPCYFILERKDNQWHLSIANPKQNNEAIELQFSSNITVNSSNGIVKENHLQIDTTNDEGRSHQVIFTK